MKKIVLFSLLCIFAFTTKAQELNFEETVKYINEKIENGDFMLGYQEEGGVYSLYPFNIIRLLKNGDIGISSKNYLWKAKQGDPIKFNLFKLAKRDDGIKLTRTSIKFWKNENEEYITIKSPSEVDNERLFKAFIHLRSLCAKEKDPFDN